MADNSLSVRSERLTGKPTPRYFNHFFDAVADPWSEDNQDGYIMAAVAENTLSANLLLERMESSRAATPVPVEIFKYNDFKGLAEFRRVFADVFQRTTMQGIQVTPENLMLSSGVTAVIDNLFFCIADPGAVCLIPAPYYPVFDKDLDAKNGVEAWPIYLHDGDDNLALQLSAEKSAVRARSKRVGALLITNPDNPTGKIYTEAQILSAIEWCCDNEVHLVVDEIYALSVFSGSQRFRSAMVLASEWAATQPERKQEKLWQYLHVLVGMSKDFCMSGFRVGGIYTYNDALIKAYTSVAIFASVSNLTQWHLLCLLSDTDFVDEYLVHNQAQLAQNCSILTEGLESMGVPFHRPEAAFFVWMNLKDQVGIHTFEREREVLDLMFHSEKIWVVNGEACHAKTPGFFRLCFAAHSAEGITVLVQRLRDFINKYKVTTARQNWDTQNFISLGGFGNPK